MKYFIVLITLISILTYDQVMNTEFPFIIKILLVALIFLTMFMWEYSIFNKRYVADFKLRSQRKTFGIFDFFNVIFWSLFLWFGYSNNKNIYFLILIFWCSTLVELVMWFIYKKKKPYTIFIKDKVLILNERWTQKRNLTELIKIKFDRINKNLKLEFKSKSSVSIKTSEYKSDDIKTLLEVLIKKSENAVSIPKNYN